LIPSHKSYAFDFFTNKHIEFPGVALVSGANQLDLKAIVTNSRDLYLFNCSRIATHHKERQDKDLSEIYHIDLHTLSEWRRVKVKQDLRPYDFFNYALIPFTRKNETRVNILLAGSLCSSRCAYIFDVKKSEISRTDLRTGSMDKLLVNGHYSYTEEGKNEIMVFGMQRIHVFDQINHEF